LAHVTDQLAATIHTSNGNGSGEGGGGDRVGMPIAGAILAATTG
jgi:hypothetical protein